MTWHYFYFCELSNYVWILLVRLRHYYWLKQSKALDYVATHLGHKLKSIITLKIQDLVPSEVDSL